MVLPRTISGVAFPEQNYFLGPFRDGNGNHYFVILDSADKSLIEVWKADNGDAVWAEQDGTNRPDSAAVIQSMWVYPDGTRLKIVTQNTSFDVEYHEFAMSDDASADTWITTTQSVDGAPDPPEGACSIGVRSDGDKFAFYQGVIERIHGVDYDRIEYSGHEGTAWGDQSGNIDDAGEVHYRGVACVVGASDLMHIFYGDDTNQGVLHKSLSSANSLSAVESVHDDNTTSSNFKILPSVYYDAAGTERITTAWRRSTTTAIWTSEIDNDGTPSAQEQAGDNTAFDNSSFVLGFLAVDPATDTVYVVYVDSATQDLFMDDNVNSGGWGTDTEILDAVTVNHISGSIFDIDNADTVIGYVYDDGGTIKYNEYVIVTGGELTISVSDSISLSEAVTKLMISYISVSNPIAISEVATVLLVHLISVSDAITLSEAVIMLILHFISVADAITLAEIVTLFIPFFNIAISESIIVSEVIQMLVVSFVNVAESISIAEIIDAIIAAIADLEISVADVISINEVINMLLTSFVSVAESVALSETITTLVINFISVASSITLSESAIVSLVHLISVSSGIAVDSTVTARLIHLIQVADSITLAEAVTFLVINFISISESITIDEAVNIVITAIGVLLITALDTIVISESVVTEITSFISVAEPIALSENAIMLLDSFISVSNSISVSESVIAQLVHLIQVSETITISEIVSFLVVSFIEVSDSISLSEAVNVIVAIAGVLFVIALDTISVSENVTGQLVSFVNVLDNISLSDNALSQLNHLVAVSDSITVSESFNAMLQNFIHVTETITISELLSIIIVGLITFRRATFKGMWKGMNRSMR